MKSRRKATVLSDLNENDKTNLFSDRGTGGISKFTESSPVALNVRRIIYLVMAGILAPLVQEAFFNEMRLFGVKPDLALIFVVTFSLILTERQALVLGLAEGLFVDILFGRVLGVYGLLFMFTGFLCALLFKDSFKTKIYMAFFAAPEVFAVFGFAESFTARIIHVLGSGGALYTDFWMHIPVRILPVSLYNVLIFAIMLYPARLLWKLLGLVKNNKVAFNRRYDDEQEV